MDTTEFDLSVLERKARDRDLDLLECLHELEGQMRSHGFRNLAEAIEMGAIYVADAGVDWLDLSKPHAH